MSSRMSCRSLVLRFSKWVATVLPLSPRHRRFLQFVFYGLLGRFYRHTEGYAVFVHQRTHAKSRRWVSERAGPTLASQEKPDVFLWGVIDWHFRIQRPQHIAKGLSEQGYRVFYFSPGFVKRSGPGFEVESLGSDHRLFVVYLGSETAPVIYKGVCTENVLEQLRESLRIFLEWTNSRQAISIIHHPFWFDLAKSVPNHRLVYDCMDYHDGFGNNSEELLGVERTLMQTADLISVTSGWLFDRCKEHNARLSLIRNACDFAHFSVAPPSMFRDTDGRKIIGYYGAIGLWFDLELVQKIAERFPEVLILLIGADTIHAERALRRYDNVLLTGEVKYELLPHYLYAMDVCIIPFRVMPLTLATNPVKAYEYLCAGKPVVAVDVPEIRELGGMVRAASSHEEFLEHVRVSLSEGVDHPIREVRRQFAREHTWDRRVQSLVDALSGVPDPFVSIIVVTYNNLDLTKACLESIERYSDYQNYEVIVVDNSSKDGTGDYLEAYCSSRPTWKLIRNTENLGFSAANNQGLRIAKGEYLVLLNNDTVVTPGWLRTLIAHFRYDSTIGILGPITNNIGNEARVPTMYEDLEDMHREARAHTLQRMGRSFEIRTLAFFCVMFPRAIYEKVGPLDEAFRIGFFEDDDYCRRVEQLGYRVICAEDVFIHHHLSAAFNALDVGTRKELFERNKAIYEKKWGKWVPHRYRD